MILLRGRVRGLRLRVPWAAAGAAGARGPGAADGIHGADRLTRVGPSLPTRMSRSLPARLPNRRTARAVLWAPSFAAASVGGPVGPVALASRACLSTAHRPTTPPYPPEWRT